jgi:hypothetical protein
MAVTLASAPITLKQAADVHWLLTQWRGAWNVERAAVLRPIPLNADGSLGPHVQLDAFQWIDVTVFGIGNVDNAIANLDREIAVRGSSLYAYALLSQDNFNALGVRVKSYRLMLAHSQVQLLFWAVAIIAAAFAAVIFIQYMTTGQSPAVNDLKSLWGDSITSLGSAAGAVGQGIATPYIWATLAAGAIAIAVAQIGKSGGFKARTPELRGPRVSGRIRGGGASASIG